MRGPRGPMTALYYMFHVGDDNDLKMLLEFQNK